MAGDSRSSSGILATRSSSTGSGRDDEIDFVEEYSLDEMPSTLSGRGALIGGLPVSTEGGSSSSSAASSHPHHLNTLHPPPLSEDDESPHNPSGSSMAHSGSSNTNNDLESAYEPPDSDYAAYIPPLLFPSFRQSPARQHHRGSKPVPLDEPSITEESAAAESNIVPASSSQKHQRRSQQRGPRHQTIEGPVVPTGSRANDSSTWGGSEPGWDEKFKKPSVWYSLACIAVLLLGVRTVQHTRATATSFSSLLAARTHTDVLLL
jgi:hypothetical protein